jgi:hypothetical protein
MCEICVASGALLHDKLKNYIGDALSPKVLDEFSNYKNTFVVTETDTSKLIEQLKSVYAPKGVGQIEEQIAEIANDIRDIIPDWQPHDHSSHYHTHDHSEHQGHGGRSH